MPEWLRLIVTLRVDADFDSHFLSLEQVKSDGVLRENTSDLSAYLRPRWPDIIEDQLCLILDRSNGSTNSAVLIGDSDLQHRDAGHWPAQLS